LAEYVEILWRRRLTVLMAIVAVPVTAVALASVQSAEYRASAEVLLRIENLNATLTGVPDLTAAQDPQRVLDTQARLARVPEIARAAVERANVTMSPDDFLDMSSVSADPSADILTFSVEAGSAEQAIELANAYAVAYTRYRAALDRRPVQDALSSVRARLQQLVDTGTTGTVLYSSLVAQMRQLESILALPSQSAVVVDRAETAPQTQPRPLRAAVLGAIAGILLGIALALVREAVEKRPRSTEAMQQQLGLRTLGRVPKTPEGGGLVGLAHPDSLDAEVYRMLRLNFEHAAPADGGVFVVTSTVEGEGKSTVAANLSVALARAGRSVILVDSDTLRPVLRERLGVGPSPGIVDVASGRASLESALVEFRLPTIALSDHSFAGSASGNGRAAAAAGLNGGVEDGALAEWPFVDLDSNGSLRVLASDPSTVEVSDYLVAAKLEGVLAELRDEADIVILDAAPLTSSVGKGISELADGIIVVANMSILRRPMLDQLAEILGEVTTPALGLVLTGVSVGTMYAYDYNAARYRGQAMEHAASDSPAPDNIRGRWSSVS
jgi:polysaccharide biosynthesis transport protein